MAATPVSHETNNWCTVVHRMCYNRYNWCDIRRSYICMGTYNFTLDNGNTWIYVDIEKRQMIDTFVCVDTETTGLSFETDLVLSLGIAIFLRGKCVRTFSFYLKNDSVPNYAFWVNGITSEDIASGYDPEWAFSLCASVMHKAPRTVLAYNAYFDLMMLSSEFKRHGIIHDFSRLYIIDPLIIERKFGRPFNNRLVAVADRYRIPYDDVHTAGSDAETAGHVFRAQCERYPIRRIPIRDLHYRQSIWYSEWAARTADYHRARGREFATAAWPIDGDMGRFVEGEQSLLW